MSAAFKKPKRGYHSFEFSAPDPSPQYSRLDTFDGLPRDRAVDAQMRILQHGHHTPVLPVTSEQVNPRTAAAFWTGFFIPVAIGIFVWSLSILTGAL